MKRWATGPLLLALLGCSTWPLGIGSPPETPRWDARATRPVISQQWVDGFVHPDDFNIDTVRVYGDGRWEAERIFSSTASRSPQVVASGSLDPAAMEAMLGSVFVRVEGQRFVDLPERLDAGIADAPTVRVSVDIENASHSVVVAGPKPGAFARVQEAIASRTVAVPFPE